MSGGVLAPWGKFFQEVVVIRYSVYVGGMGGGVDVEEAEEDKGRKETGIRTGHEVMGGNHSN